MKLVSVFAKYSDIGKTITIKKMVILLSIRCYNCNRAVTKKLILLFIIALLFRFILIPIAFHGDLYNNLSWGQAAVSFGLKGFYERTVWTHSAPNQPPLYILLFGFSSYLFNVINNLVLYLNSNVGIFPSAFVWFWHDNGNIILLKLPSIFADIGIGFLIYYFFKKRQKETLGFKLAVLWLINPITFYNSAIWGQTDSIVNLIGLLSIYFLLERKLIGSLLFLVLSLLFKGSLAIFVPVFILLWFFQKHSIRDWVKAIVVTGAVTVLTSFWFHPSFDLPIWLFSLYSNRFFPGEIGYLTANAFNFWYLINPGKVLDSKRYFGITAHIWGYILSSIAIITAIVKKRTHLEGERNILFLLALMALITFLFFTRIHERYLYPFFPIATILIGFVPEMLVPYIVLSFVFLVNMYNLFWAPGIPSLQNALTNTTLPAILSLINLAVFGIIFGGFLIGKGIIKK